MASTASPESRAHLQDNVARTRLPQRVASTLGRDYAGVWFEPATATLHVGVTSGVSAGAAQRIAASAGLAADVVTTPVRSTWAALIDAQNQWNKRLAALLAQSQASTGIEPSDNSVSITLSASVPASERSTIEREAGDANVNVSVAVAEPSSLEDKPRAKCKTPFVELVAYCEKTLVSGVGIAPNSEGPLCTAGPMLISGKETYMLTSGHCYNLEEAEGAVLKVFTNSAYPNLEQKKVGTEAIKYYSSLRDMAEIKITRPGSPFIAEPPTPLPALMAEWLKKPEVPHTVGGSAAVVSGQEVCHEGMVSGEACGEVKKLNMTNAGKEHLVEVTACGSRGDSGGPYFFRGKGEEVIMLGIETQGPLPECHEKGPYKSFFEPLEGVPGALRYGILQTFTGQAVLTTGNETRTKTEEEEKERKEKEAKLPDFSIALGGSYPINLNYSSATVKTKYSSAAEGLSGEGLALSFTSTELSAWGFFESTLKGVVNEKGTKCNSVGKGAGEVQIEGKYHIVYVSLSPLTLGILFSPEAFEITCGTGKVTAKGSMLGSLKLGSSEAEELTSLKSELTGNAKGKPTLKSYYNDAGEAETAKFEVNFGTGFKEAAWEVGGEVTATAEAGKMFTITRR